MTEPVLLQEQLEHVRVLRLNRPERKNALNDGLGWAIVEAVEAASRDDDVRAITTTGGGDAFCSGLDLRDDGGRARPSLTAQERALDDFGWVNRFPLGMRLQCDKPVVAGINGVAVGTGFSLAMAADGEAIQALRDKRAAVFQGR